MREILFRGFYECNNGKQKVFVNGKQYKGEWVYGYPVIDTGNCSLKEKGKCLCPHDGTSIFFWNDDFHEYTDCEIIPSTVGQYTGLTDKNGTKIFEGDILQYINQDNEAHCITVVFEECAFLIEDCGVTDCDLLPSYACLGFEVVGNIHDNPELLKGEAE